MRVAVTGAEGELGRAVVAQLADHGYQVVAIDLQDGDSSVDDHRIEYRVADLTDRQSTESALQGTHAVLHLAAIPNPKVADGWSVFHNNVNSVYCVIDAAIAIGIERVVYTSSQSALGNPWAPEILPINYIPVDEEHPCRPCDSYGLSKKIGEETCDFFVRSFQVRILSLRLPAIWPAEQFAERTEGRLNNPIQAAKSMWAYVDLRDAARAHRLALEAEWEGHEVVNVTTRWAFGSAPLSELVHQWYPDVTDLRVPLEESTPVFDCRKADRLLNFRSRYRWTTKGIVDCNDQ